MGLLGHLAAGGGGREDRESQFQIFVRRRQVTGSLVALEEAGALFF